jgi:hypothetical protein
MADKEKSRRPEGLFSMLCSSHSIADTPFKQQRMKAWQPILTPVKVIGIFLILGIIFIPVGTSLLASSQKVLIFAWIYDLLPSSCVDL